MRISKKDKAEYQRLKQNIKGKVSRVAKKTGLDISGMLDIPDLNSISRKEFNAFKEEAKRFTARTHKVTYTPQGVPTTNMMMNQMKEMEKLANKRAKEMQNKINDRPFISGGTAQGTVGHRRVLMLDEPDALGYKTLENVDFNKIKDKYELEKIYSRLKKKTKGNGLTYYDETMQRMKDNWLRALDGSFDEEANNLKSKVEALPADVFYELYMMFDEFDFRYYDSEGQDVEATSGMIKQLESYLNRYADGKLNIELLLKDFPNKI